MKEEDIPQVVDELRSVWKKTILLGRLLRVPKARLDAIHNDCFDLIDCIFHVIDEYINQKESRPTWKEVIDVLKHPLMRENNLARVIETKHCPSSSEDGKDHFIQHIIKYLCSILLQSQLGTKRY